MKKNIRLITFAPRSMPIFKKKKSSQTFQGIFFLENRHTKIQFLLQKRPQHRSMWLHSSSVHNSVYQASHCRALLKGWLNLCNRACIDFLLAFLTDVDFRTNCNGAFCRETAYKGTRLLLCCSFDTYPSKGLTSYKQKE